jgi:hypothetical protein
MRPAWLALATLLAAGAHAFAQTPVVRLDFTDQQANPWRWTLTLHPDGSGHFTSQRNTAPISPGQELEAPDINRDIQVTPQFAQRVFLTAQREHWFNEPCASHLKVAFQGWKKLSYQGPQGAGSCTFNYSKIKDVQALSDSLLAVEQTILEGARLEMFLEHDPLGLNKEMQFLTQAAQNGEAQQICTIRGILQRLAQDDQVMDLVRKQARKLLARQGT